MRCITLALGAVVLACGPAGAQDTRHTLELGVLYNSNRDSLVDGFSGTGVPAQASLDAGNSTGALLSYEFYALPNLGLQLNAGFGGSLTVDGAGSLAAAGALFKAKPLSVSGFVNYHFFDPGNALRPFVGIGATYTSFSSIESYAGQNVDMSSSWALAAQAGARYAFDRNWSLGVSLGFNWSKSDISFSDAGGAQRATLEFRPVIVGLAVGYSF
jgi:outer membrane protein